MQQSTEMHISCNAEEEKLKEVAEKEIYDNEQTGEIHHLMLKCLN